MIFLGRPTRVGVNRGSLLRSRSSICAVPTRWGWTVDTSGNR